MNVVYILKKLKDFSIESFSKINNKIIDQYLNKSNFDLKTLDGYTLDELKLILDRIGNGIEKKNKEKIIESIESKSQNNYINILLINMIEIYKIQKRYSAKVGKTRKLCGLRVHKSVEKVHKLLVVNKHWKIMVN